MKKILLVFIVLMCMISIPVKADDGWDDFGDIDRAWDGQKSITNQEFEKAIDTLEGKKKQKDEKKRKKMIKKVSGGGQSLHPEMDANSEIQALTPTKKNEDGLLLNIPVSLIIDDIPLEKGFYKVIAEKDENGDIYFSFYQSRFFKGKVRASETTNDFGKDTIDFIDLQSFDDNFIKIIYGSLDFNAYAYIRYQTEY